MSKPEEQTIVAKPLLYTSSLQAAVPQRSQAQLDAIARIESCNKELEVALQPILRKYQCRIVSPVRVDIER